MNNIEYSYRKNSRSRHISITIDRDLTVKVRVPLRASMQSAQAFVVSKMAWIEKKIAFLQKKRSNGVVLPRDRASYLQFREPVREIILREIAIVNQIYGFHYKRISIRDQDSRWGSCSKTGNLNFNYRLIFLPEDLRKYVLAHELCHLQEMNHSHRFWLLVSKAFPHYRECVRRLKRDFVW